MEQQQAAVALEGNENFNQDEVKVLIKEAIESNISNQPYHHNKVPQWNSNIVEMTLKKLSGLNKSFKFIVTCVIMQRTGAGLHVGSSCFWDSTTDGCCTFEYDSKTMVVVVNVFALAI